MSDDTPPPVEPVPAWLLDDTPPPERYRLDLVVSAATFRPLAELAELRGCSVEDVAAELLAGGPLDMLDAAGFDLAPAADGQTWAAVDRATGYTWALGATPDAAAGDALAALRRRYVEAAPALGQVEQLRAELAEARDRLPEGERWCEGCQGYEYDYGCGCRRCAECDRKIPAEPSHELLDLMGEAVLCDECIATLYAPRGYRRRRGPRPERRPPIGPALGL